MRDFQQIKWNDAVAEECRRIVRAAKDEDLAGQCDWTTAAALVPADAVGRAAVVTRQAGVVAGLPGARIALAEYDPNAKWSELAADGDAVSAGQRLAIIEGPARSLLTAERVLLNLLGRLSGIASLTAKFVAAAGGTKAHVYDTRKTTPGWRLLEKYAVRCGGGRNHRLGLYDAVLIKDNHLVVGAEARGGAHYTPAEAVRRARQFMAEAWADRPTPAIIEVEVDSLEQLKDVLPERPDIVLLDNMSPDQLTAAVAIRDMAAPGVELEASGGVRLETVAAIARTGVERISAGVLTHGAMWLDIGLDWE